MRRYHVCLVLCRMMGPLRVIVAEWPQNQFFNMALEEAIYLEAKRPTLRLWRNDRAVIIGRYQSPILEVNALEAKKLGVKLVRRFTGGGAVYHDLGNVNYALTLPSCESIDIEAMFRLMGEAIVEALKSLGINGACYRPLNDIEVNGLKISGMAASRTSNRAFIHGAMLVSSDISTLWRILKISKEKLSDKKLTESKIKRVTTVREALGKDISLNEVYEVVANAIAEKFAFKAMWGEVEYDEIKRSLDLYRRKYSKLEWNLAYVNELKALISKEEENALKDISTPDPAQERAIEGLEA